MADDKELDELNDVDTTEQPKAGGIVAWRAERAARKARAAVTVEANAKAAVKAKAKALAKETSFKTGLEKKAKSYEDASTARHKAKVESAKG